ncbi:MAG: hypothetical protein AB1349_05795 [Elusimicrobiota bacterium]
MKKIIVIIIVSVSVGCVGLWSKGEGSSTISKLSSTAVFSENFDDGDISQNPSWTVFNDDDDYPYPGTITILQGKLKISRYGAGGNGGAVGCRINVDIPVTNRTKVQFDVKAVYSNVAGGAGYTFGEYPANVCVVLNVGKSTPKYLNFAYNYRGGRSDSKEIRIFQNVPQNVWQLNESFRIREYVPDAQKIIQIAIFGSGWDYESYFDNLFITDEIRPVTTEQPVVKESKDKKDTIATTYDKSQKAVWTPLQISLIPTVSLFKNPNVVGLDIGLIGTKSNRTYGIQCSPMFNIVEEYLYGAQISILGNKAGDIYGIECGLSNETKNFYGLQSGLINKVKDFVGIQFVGWNTCESFSGIQVGGWNTTKNFLGLQGIGLMNKTGNFKGIQLGSWNVADKFLGIQLAGICNKTQNFDGLQVSGLWNKAARFRYLQVSGLVNKAGDFDGIQFGTLWNRTSKFCGFQIGSINITDEFYGVRVGVFNGSHKFCGAQLGGLLNITLDITEYSATRGIQIGGINVTSSFSGVQIGSILNWNHYFRGIQIGGLVNTVDDFSGIQIAGLFNKATDLKGLQIAGLLNKAKDLKGMQVGFINSCWTLKGVQIGAVNIVSENPQLLRYMAILNFGW